MRRTQKGMIKNVELLQSTWNYKRYESQCPCMKWSVKIALNEIIWKSKAMKLSEIKMALN